MKNTVYLRYILLYNIIVITKNNTIDRKPSNKIILPAVTTFTPKSSPVVPKIKAPIELLLSDDDCERTSKFIIYRFMLVF